MAKKFKEETGVSINIDDLAANPMSALIALALTAALFIVRYIFLKFFFV